MQDVFEIDVKGVKAVDYRETENRVFTEHHLWMYDPIDLVQFISIHFSISSIVKKAFRNILKHEYPSKPHQLKLGHLRLVR